MTTDATLPYRLGLPAWAFPGWRGRYFRPSVSALAEYAKVFNAVEGNTSFYSVPAPDSVAAWASAVAGRDFRFCFKLPRSVTHDRNMSGPDLRRFLTVIEPLQGSLGPLLIQFPAWIGPNDLDGIEALLRQIPAGMRTAIEVRHPRLFSEPELLEPMLDRHAAGRVVMDTRPLYQGDRQHPEVTSSLHEKPDLPVLATVYGGMAFVRCVLHPDQLDNQRFLDEWAGRFQQYHDQGVDSHMMIHCPNNLHCPVIAETFHQTLRRQPGMARVPELPPWPMPQQASLL